VRARPRAERERRRRWGAAWALVLALACAEAAREPDAPYLEIRGRRVELEIARTPAEQRRGLGYRDALPWHRGMLFVYERPDFYAFWMKGMRFDIDIVWMREGRIVDIAHRVPHDPESNGPTVRPGELADRVLEVPAGYALAHGWQPGDPVQLHGATP